MSLNSIAENYKSIKDSLPEGVLLLAVSKTKPAEDISKAIEAGCRDFGENKAQELCAKYELFPDVNWHFIGRLQRNKVKNIVGKACLIHSVDSMELALEIEKRAEKINKIQDILIQVNVAGEVQKGGVPLSEADELTEKITELPHIRLRGFMQVAPETDNPENVRMYFRQLKALSEKYNPEILSMGMSGDYKVAIEEGANCVRIGSAIFGKRNYLQER